MLELTAGPLDQDSRQCNDKELVLHRLAMLAILYMKYTA